MIFITALASIVVLLIPFGIMLWVQSDESIKGENKDENAPTGTGGGGAHGGG